MIALQDKQDIQEKLNQAQSILTDNLKESFEYIHANPQDKKDMVDMWSNFIRQLIIQVYEFSDKYNEKDLIKSITKTIMFGR